MLKQFHIYKKRQFASGFEFPDSQKKKYLSIFLAYWATRKEKEIILGQLRIAWKMSHDLPLAVWMQ